MKKIVYIFLMLATTAIVINACKHPAAEVQPSNPGTGGTGGGTGGTGGGGTGGGGTGGGTTTTDTGLCFERDVLPIFKTNCATPNCHNVATKDNDRIALNTYEQIIQADDDLLQGDPDESDIYKAITEDDPDDRMPRGRPGLKQATIDTIKRWILLKAPNSNGCTTTTGGGTGGGTGSGCDESRFSFAAIVQPILNANCVNCHTTGSGSKGVALDNYNGVRVVAADGRLMRTITHAPGITRMPFNAAKLSDCNIRLIQKWVDAGFQNN